MEMFDIGNWGLDIERKRKVDKGIRRQGELIIFTYNSLLTPS